MSEEMRPMWDAERLARLAGGEELEPALYVLATPIGHLGDLTLRAIRLLGEADEIWCEDTRVTRKLLSALGLKGRRLHRFDAHSGPGAVARILDAVAAGRRVVLASDAGTPLVSDPGADLVAAAHRRGVRVVPVPGPSALTAALSAAGFGAPPALFLGFAPARRGERLQWLGRWADVPATLVIYEAPHRLGAALADMLAVLGDRPVVLARELTKRHEEIMPTTLSALFARVRRQPPRGEIVLVVAPPEHAGARAAPEPGPDAQAVAAMLREAAAQHPPARAARLVALRTGLDRRELYRRLTAAKKADGEGGDGAPA
ncbi:MAG: ribosomal RNA small subunit methyltransferase I [Rhodothalassiaceae bacterium]|nr:MAG: ribosomal RNA small subunit methyltransferase I [Rhodothalassiaceae bacterium]